MVTITQTALNSFGPLTQVFLKPLGLEDKNNNGIIDKDAGEGYEEFLVKYGNADLGYKNDFNLQQHENDNKLLEKEIIDYYYLNIRFAFPEETAQIDTSLEEMIRKSDIFPAWLDSPEGSIRLKIEKLGAQYFNQSQGLTSSAGYLLTRKMITALRPTWYNNYAQDRYLSLSAAVEENSFSCYESTMLGFWFASKLQVRTMPMYCYQESSTGELVAHLVLDFSDSKERLDMTPRGRYLKIPEKAMTYENPVQMIGDYYYVLANTDQYINTLEELQYREKALLFQKEDNSAIAALMKCYLYGSLPGTTPDYKRAIELGEEVLSRVDYKKLASGELYPQKLSKQIVSNVVGMLIKSYVALGEQKRYAELCVIAKNYLSDNDYIQRSAKLYGFPL